MSLASDRTWFQEEAAQTLISAFQATARSKFAEVGVKTIVVMIAQIVQMECTAERVLVGLIRQRVQCRGPHLMSVKLIMNVRTINSVGMQARPLRWLIVNYA